MDQDAGCALVIIQLRVEGIDRIAVPYGEVTLSVTLFKGAFIAGRPVADVGEKCPQHLVGVNSLHIAFLPPFIEERHR